MTHYTREYVSEQTYHEWMTRGFPRVGDLLFTTEAPMGNVCIVDITDRFALAQRAIDLQPFGPIDSRFFMYAIMSHQTQSLIASHASGMTATGIKAARLKLIPLPIPPLGEQHRMVAKVDQLMALCDDLADKIESNQTTAEHFAGAVVAELAA